jgi:hypothetical protein
MEFLLVMLNEISLVGDVLSMTVVELLVAEFLLDVVTGRAEDDDACDLNADVAPGAGSVSSEEGDGSGDHVGAEERSGVDEELLGVEVAVPAEDNGGDGLNDELGVGGGEVAHEEGPADGADVGAHTDTEDGGMDLFESQAAVGDETEDSESGNGHTS